MKNLAAGFHVSNAHIIEMTDKQIREELTQAGIPIKSERGKSEVPYTLIGNLNGWIFTRAWYYWVARGPGIPFEKAKILFDEFGKDVRSNGHCLSVDYPPYGFVTQVDERAGGVCAYHIDTQKGLNALAAVIEKL